MAQDERPLTGKASGHCLSSSTSIVYHLHLYTAFPRIRTTLTQRVLSLFLEVVRLNMSRGLLPPECWSIQASSDEHYLFALGHSHRVSQGIADWVWWLIVVLLIFFSFFFPTVPNIDTTKYFSSSPMTSPCVACWRANKMCSMNWLQYRDGPEMVCTSFHLHQIAL